MPRHPFEPRDAMRLLRDPRRITFACDVAGNKAFARADARTCDAHGLRLCDVVRGAADVADMAKDIAGLVDLGSRELEARLRGEPVRLGVVPASGRRAREVGVATYRRRCLSNLVTDVLSTTSDRLLSPIARAYRAGNERAVQNTVLEVAGAVSKRNIVFWAKLDFVRYFDVIPRRAIEVALLHYGYEPRFIELVLTLVRCRVVRISRGRRDDHHTWRGLQQGLPESSVLANMMPFALDAALEDLVAKGVHVARYSDDVFIGGPTKRSVREGVQRVLEWARGQGILVKDDRPSRSRGPKTAAQAIGPHRRTLSWNIEIDKLVERVHQRRIPLLGTEIDQHGTIHIPKDVLTRKLDEIREIVAKRARAPIVEGTSLYGGGAGVDLYDGDDLEAKVEGWASYWGYLNREEADFIRRIIEKRFPVTRVPRRRGSGIVWRVRLWGDQTSTTSEAMIPQGPMGVTAHCDPSLDLGIPHRTSTAPPGQSTSRGGDSLDPIGTRDPEENTQGESKGPEPIPPKEQSSRWMADALHQENVSDPQPNPVREDGRGALSVRRHCCPSESSDGCGVSTPLRSTGCTTSRFLVSSLERVLGHLDGSDYESDRGEPPLPPDLADAPMVHVAVARAESGGCIVAQATVFRGAVIGHPTSREVSSRPEVAELAAILQLVEQARDTRLVVALPTTRLAKHLLQPGKAFRAPIRFGLVERLHEVARERAVDLHILGGVPVPDGIRVLVEARP